MRVLCSGSTGFIGSRLVEELRRADYDVWELVRYRAGGFDYWGKKQIKLADLRDGEAIYKAFEEVKPEVVVHLAAQSAVAYSFQNPGDVSQVNYGGTIRMVEAAKKFDVMQFIFASTSEVYGATNEYPLRETSAIGGLSPYAVSKIAAENYIRLQMELHKFPATIMRPFNTYSRALVGNNHFVVERAIYQAITEGRISLHDPEPRREFLFRDDHVSAYMHAILNRKRSVGETFNVCVGKAYSIREMAECVAKIAKEISGVTVTVEFAVKPDRPLDIPVLHGDSSHIRETLGWSPKYSFEEGMRKAFVEWKIRINDEKNRLLNKG